MFDFGTYLKWYDDGIGQRSTYPEKIDYFEEYSQKNKQSQMGALLNAARIELVQQFLNPREIIVDIGIGDGSFITSRGNSLGFDVDPKSLVWLDEQSLLWNQEQIMEGMCFWDSLEHIPDPSKLLEKCSRFVFVSMPIFIDLEHLARSKHNKPKEHYWYFTKTGLTIFMLKFGFELVYYCDVESQLGREDIGTFVFRRT